jgi:3'-5' exonuclease
MAEQKTSLKNILFIDIETVSVFKAYDELPTKLQELWKKKASKLKNEELESVEEMFFNRAAIYAEFGKVLCIGVGGIYEKEEGNKYLKAKTLVADSETELLLAFKDLLEKHTSGQELVLCAHNGKEFDFPYLCRRMLINGVSLPKILDISNKKPWEIKHIDTLELWKFGDYKSFTSLDLLAAVFNIPSSKSEIDGSQVNATYYIDNDLEKIARYCKEDVVVLAQLYLKLNTLDSIPQDNILRV